LLPSLTAVTAAAAAAICHTISPAHAFGVGGPAMTCETDASPRTYYEAAFRHHCAGVRGPGTRYAIWRPSE